MMKVGTVLESYKTLYVVAIEGRGGGDAHDEYFETEEDAILASAVDGRNRMPKVVTPMKFSDGTIIIQYTFVDISPRPPESEIAKLVEGLTPAQKLLLKKSP